MNVNGKANVTHNGRVTNSAVAIRNNGASLREWISPGNNGARLSPADSSPFERKKNTLAVVAKGVPEDSPPPAPLHIIQSLVSQQPIIRGGPSLSTHTFTASETSAPFEAQLEKTADGYESSVGYQSDSGEAAIDENFHYRYALYLGAWLVSAADRSTNDPLVQWAETPEHERCDVDTLTGELRSPVQQPNTVAGEKATDDDGNDITFKCSLTSYNHMQIAIRYLETKRPEAVQTCNNLNGTTGFGEIEWPKADCVVRPAKESDLSAIAKIASIEAQGLDGCPQIILSQDAVASEMKRLLDFCRNSFRPFIVAESKADVLLNRDQWPAAADKAYAEYIKYKHTQPAEETNIVGFAFVSELKIGFLNMPCPGSRHSGQIRLVVDPKHRQNAHGTALLDKILQSVAAYHRSLIDFDWQDAGQSDVYEYPVSFNRRRYARVYIEVLVEPKEELAGWKRKMLEKFQFKQAARFTKMVKTDHGDKSKWLDVMVWELDTAYEASIVNKAPGAWLKRDD